MLSLHYIFIKRQLRPDVGRSILKLIDDNQNANLALFQFDQCCKRCESLILNRLRSGTAEKYCVPGKLLCTQKILSK